MFEDKITEFKREYTDDIKYSIVAFANSDGGTLYIGINDDGSVCGVEDGDKTMLRVTNMVRDVIRPDITMFVSAEIKSFEQKNVIAVNVQSGTAKPYYIGAKGVRPEGVYVRQGASSVPASETAILNMIKETSGDSYEDARSLNQNLTFDTASDYFAKKGIEFGEAQMRTLNIISKDGTYSNLGMLLSDQCVHSIKLAVFEGSKKSVFRDRKDLSGSILKQLEDAYSFIDRYNRTRSEFSGLYRVDKKDYPAEALRESLLNAIVHRDYSISGSTLISIFDDRIEFVTIGGLVKGMTFNDIMLGVSVLRNQHLANVFYRLNLIEAYGTGILKIRESYSDYTAKPKIDVSDNAFKITLPNANYVKSFPYSSDLSFVTENDSVLDTEFIHRDVPYSPARRAKTREDIVIDFLKKNDTIVRKDVEKLLGVSQPTAVLIIRDMLSKGILCKVGSGRFLKYRLTERKKY